MELTTREWAELDEGTSGELVDGHLEEEEATSTLQAAVATCFACRMGAWVANRGGVAFGAGLKFIVAPRHGRQADASAYFPGRPFPGRHSAATSRPPTIVLEVTSSRPLDVRRDRVDKLRDYAAFGVTYYWIADPYARTLEIRQLDPGGRHITLLSAADGTHPAPGCEGLTIDLDALWAEVDQLPDDDEPEAV